MARPRKIKEGIQEFTRLARPEAKSAAKKTQQVDEKLPKRPTNIELYAQSVIHAIQQEELAVNFEKAIEFHGTKKVTIRVERDVYDFYENLPLDCTTAMKKALRIVMDAARTHNFKF